MGLSGPLICFLFPECVAKGSRFTFGGLGVDPCSRDPASGVRNRLQPFATVCNRPQLSATVLDRLGTFLFHLGAVLSFTFQPSHLGTHVLHDLSLRRTLLFCSSDCTHLFLQKFSQIPVLVTSVCDRRGLKVAVPIGKVAKTCLFRRVTRCAHVVLRGRRGTSWHSNMFQDVSKVVLCGRRNTFAIFSEDVLHFSWQTQHFGHLRCHFAWQAQHFRRVVLRVFCESYILSALRKAVTRCKFRGRRGIL